MTPSRIGTDTWRSITRDCGIAANRWPFFLLLTYNNGPADAGNEPACGHLTAFPHVCRARAGSVEVTWRNRHHDSGPPERGSAGAGSGVPARTQDGHGR